MKLFWHRNVATEPQEDGNSSELSLVRDSRGNWIDEATGEIYARVEEPEDEDGDLDADA